MVQMEAAPDPDSLYTGAEPVSRINSSLLHYPYHRFAPILGKRSCCGIGTLNSMSKISGTICKGKHVGTPGETTEVKDMDRIATPPAPAAV